MAASEIRKTLPGPSYHSEETYRSTRNGSSTATGSTSDGPSGCRGPAPGCGSRSAARASWSCAARTTRSAASTTSAATAGRGSATTSRATCAAPALPVPRLGLRPGRHARHHADDREGRDRPRDHRPCGRCTPTSGRASSSSTSPARSRGRCSSTSPTSRTTRWPWPGSACPTCGSGTSPPWTSRPTGRSCWRTTTSACTARPIHPELVAVVPAYKKGSIFEDGRDDGGVTLADGRTAIVTDARLRLPLLPGFKEQTTPAVLLRRAASTRRCSSTSTARPASRPRSSRPARRAAGW